MASKILVKRGTTAPAAAALTQYELAVDTTNKRTYIGAADGSGILVGFGTATSAEMASIVTDETGSGKLVFGTSPEITTSLTTASSSFDLLNTTVRTLNIGGVANTINIMGTTDTAALAASSFYQVSIGNALLTPTTGQTYKYISIGGDTAATTTCNILIGGRATSYSTKAATSYPAITTTTIYGNLDLSQSYSLIMPNTFTVGTSPLIITGTPISMASPGESFIRDTAGNGLNIGDNADGAPIKIGDYANTFGSGTLLTIDASLGTIYLAAANGTSVDGLLGLIAQAELRFFDSDSSNYVGFKSPATVTANKIWILPSADGTSGQVLSTNGSATLSWATASGGGTAAGSDTYVQFNDGGTAFGGDSGLTYNKTTDTLTIGLTSTAGILNMKGQGELRFNDADSSNYVALKSAATVSSNITWTLPSVDGSGGQMLSTNGSGTLYWATPPGAELVLFNLGII